MTYSPLKGAMKRVTFLRESETAGQGEVSKKEKKSWGWCKKQRLEHKKNMQNVRPEAESSARVRD